MWEHSPSAALSFNIMQFSEMKCSIIGACTAATLRTPSARWRTARGNYRPIKTPRLLSACCSTETNKATVHLSFILSCHLLCFLCLRRGWMVTWGYSWMSKLQVIKAFVPVFFSCSCINDQQNCLKKNSHNLVHTIRTAAVIQQDARFNLKV